MENNQTQVVYEKFFTWYKTFWFCVYFLMMFGSYALAEITVKTVWGKSAIQAIADSGLSKAK